MVVLMATKRVRRRTRKPVLIKAKAGKGKKKAPRGSGANGVAALERKLASMQVNTSPFSAAGRILGGRIGGAFGNANVGSNIGSWLGSGVGKIFGSGAYKMSANSLWSTTDQCPVMHSASESVILRHREYIRDVNSSVAFVNNEFSINPGLPGTFPFLSTIASNFQEYNFKGLVFEFKSTSADALNSTNTALGTIAMAVQYRAGATSFTTKQQVLNEMWSADSKPANSFFMPVECAPAECPMDIQYVRTGALGSNDDVKFYDLGKLALSSVGSQATAVVGELWASYEVCLRKPVLSGAIGSDIEAYSSFRGGVTSVLPLGTADNALGINSLGVVVTPTTITIPSGNASKYVVIVEWLGPAASVFVTPIIGLTNMTAVSMNGNTNVAAGDGVSSTGCTRTAIVYLTDPASQGVITYGVAGTLTAPVYAYVNIATTDFDIVST